jgi:hypothetical protein
MEGRRLDGVRTARHVRGRIGSGGWQIHPRLCRCGPIP